MSMLLWPIVCIAVWSAEQFRLQCTLECPQRRQRRDRRRQHIPNLCRGNGEGAIANVPIPTHVLLVLSVYPQECLSNPSRIKRYSQRMYLCMYSVWLKMSDQHGGTVQNLRQKSTTESILFYKKKRINIPSNLQYFVEKCFPAITECNLCRMDAYTFWIYAIAIETSKSYILRSPTQLAFWSHMFQYVTV